MEQNEIIEPMQRVQAGWVVTAAGRLELRWQLDGAGQEPEWDEADLAA